MLDFSPEKMLVIFFLVLIVLGPEKLPELSRKMGRAMGELRKLSGGFQDEMRRAMSDMNDDSGSDSTASSGDSEIASGAAAPKVDDSDEASGS